jgi:apolipoprotein N-acyltransferase
MNPLRYLTAIDWRRLGLAVGSGWLCALAFPNPFYIQLSWWGGWFSCLGLVPLFYLAAENWKQAAGWGFCFGLAYFGVSVVWMAFMPAMAPVAPGVWLLLTIYLAIYTAAFMGITQILSRRGLPLWSTAPALWVALEYLRNYALSGFPWAVLGAAHYRNPWLMSLASFSGVWGLSWLTVLCNAILFALLLPRNAKNRMGGDNPLGGRLLHILAAAVVALTIVTGGWLEHRRLANIPDKVAVKVAALQGNINQNQEWNETYRRSTLNRFFELGSQALAQKAELLIWPESAFPGIFNWDQTLAGEVRSWSRSWQVDQIVSADTIGLGTKAGEYQYFNTMLWLDPQGTVTGSFSKIHLVPFGEFIPFKHTLLFFVRKLVPRYENGEFTPGASREPLVWHRTGGDTRVGGLICFESIFPQYAAELVRKGSELLVVVTYDAWFGTTAAPAQHAIFSALRAAETDRYVMQTAATGISCAFGPTGQLLDQVPLNTAGVLLAKVGLRTTQTFFVRWGSWLPWWCVMWILLLLIVGARRAVPLQIKTNFSKTREELK